MKVQLIMLIALSLLILGITNCSSLNKLTDKQDDPPTLYEYFIGSTDENITGLTAEKEGFRLNGKSIRMISGAVHYFRIHPDLWRNRLRKLRASGANTVETYVAWNLHEPTQGQFDFGLGDNDMSMFLDIRRFIQIAKEEDLILLLRPGPFICSEFEFGGLPSWLLRDPDMKVRTAYQPYLDRAKIYLDNLLPLVQDLQFTRGGPIVALQIENEYASFDHVDKSYLELIKKTYEDNGIDSLFFTSDGSWNKDKGSLPDVLKTANFQSNPKQNLDDLINFQPDKPPMVMEYWAGWFDHWFENHSITNVTEFTNVLEVILGTYNASVNFYMFHGGTNYGFLAGANSQDTEPFYMFDVQSYDYDGPLSESGDYTEKYFKIMELVEKYQEPVLKRPEMISESTKVAYPSIQLQKFLTYDDILNQVPSSSKFTLDRPVSMENLDMNNGNGQSYGYTLYRKTIALQNDTTFRAGPVRDFGILLVDGIIQSFPQNEDGSTKYWLNTVQEYSIGVSDNLNHTIDLLVENMGRVNFGGQKDFEQQKGLLSTGNDSYLLDGEEIHQVEIIALEFKSQWVKSLTNWRVNNNSETLVAPVLIQSTFVIDNNPPADTFIDMSSWGKGIVFINGFNLGRYFNVGPQKTLYLPSPFLQSGTNTITIFEQLQPGKDIVFSDSPNLGPAFIKPLKPIFDGNAQSAVPL